MDTAVKGIARPDQYVGGCAQIPKQAVRALSAPIRGFVRLGHDHHDVVVAVSPPSPRARDPKKIDALRLARVNQALNNFPEKWVLACVSIIPRIRRSVYLQTRFSRSSALWASSCMLKRGRRSCLDDGNMHRS